MSNPYEVSSKDEKLKDTAIADRRHHRGWWWPLVASLVFTPIAIYGNTSYGQAHGDNLLDAVFDGSLFPLERPFHRLFKSETADGFFFLLQFPVYGAFISLCARRNRLLEGCAVVTFFHLLTYLFAKLTSG